MILRAPRSLQGRLLLLVLGAVLAIWLVTAVATWLDMQHELDELLDSHLAQAAALLVVQQAGELGDDDDHHHRPDAPSLHRYAPQVAFQVWQAGRLTVRSANAPSTPMGPTQALAPVANPPGERVERVEGVEAGEHRRGGKGEDRGRGRDKDRDRSRGHDRDHDRADDDGELLLRSGFRTLTLDGTTWRVFATHGAERDVQVYVGEQVDSRSAILRALMRSLFWPMALALPLLALAAWWGIHRGVAPLRKLGTVLQARQPRALGPVELQDTPSEMAPMLAALNGLFERIHALMEKESRFTADAAHELRTPIAAIRTQAQVALAESDDARRSHALRATLQGCDRATRLVEQLLTLSRLQAQPTNEMPVVDFRTVTERTVADVAAQAVGKQQVLDLVSAEPCPVHGNEALLAVLVRNLVDNAVRYSPAGARIRISLRAPVAGDAHVVLVVEDSGPGLQAGDMQRLGERFFRVLGTGESGSGLGWSIVRQIADVHGAQVQVSRSEELGGLLVRVAFVPAAVNPPSCRVINPPTGCRSPQRLEARAAAGQRARCAPLQEHPQTPCRLAVSAAWEPDVGVRANTPA